MYRLVYFSANRMKGSFLELSPQIDQILATSRRNNARVDVTGALLFSEGFFGQVLEGPQAAIEATFERIQRDSRHGDVSLLSFQVAEKRSFTHWSMAFVGQQASAMAGFDQVGLNSGFEFEKLKAEKLLNRLIELVAGENV